MAEQKKDDPKKEKKAERAREAQYATVMRRENTDDDVEGDSWFSCGLFEVH